MAVATPPEAGSVPPHNEEAEASVLGAILLTEQALDGILLEVGLRPEDFYRPRNGLIFRAMVRLKEKAEPEAVDALTVTEDLRRAGELDKAGGAAYIHSLPALVPAVGAVLDYARIVKENSILRSLLAATRDIQEEVLAHRGEPRELIERAEAILFKIGHDGGSAEMKSIETILHEEIDKLEELSRKDVGLTGTASGFTDLDQLTGGFQRGNLIVVAARPSMGKCLGGDALILDPRTGGRRPMLEVVEAVERGEEVWVAALGADLRLRPARATAAARNGTQPLYRVTTALGRHIEATAGHPLFTLAGWRPLEDLSPGDRVAVPVRLPPRAAHPAHREHEGPPSPARQAGTRDASYRASTAITERTHAPQRAIAATSDVWWDEVARVEPAGERETFDLTVPLHHNYVADDIVVHNSTLATNIAENAAIDHGVPVALFSLEMSETELAHRFIASQARVSSDELRKGRVRGERWPKVLNAVEKLASAPIYLDDSSDIGVLEIRAKARRLHARHGLGLIVVDYLQLVRPDTRADSRVEQVGQISRGLKILARELNIPVIAVSQLSRAVESRNPPIPMLSDLRESGQLEQDADVVMFVYREDYYDDQSERIGEADLIIAKHRNGPIGKVTLTFLSKYPRFASLYRERGVEPAATGNGLG
ncbi:MAG: replicative DNA helicase [Thermoleophilaceae bacterium]|nr:replicative DNA helicase [Thermoleophilaceae bacterium]